MSVATEIRRAQRVIFNLKKLVHEPRDGRPVARGVAKLHQIQLRHWKGYLKELEKLSKELKQLNKELGRTHHSS
jgi:hypothetical protein